jgi:hypothetical protein
VGLRKATPTLVVRFDDGGEANLIRVLQRVGTVGKVSPIARTNHYSFDGL